MSSRSAEAGGPTSRGARKSGSVRTLSALPPVPAGDFASWLASALAALAEEAPADVPCGSCNACCRTSHFIHVRPEERRARARLPRELLFPAPGLPPGNLVLAYDKAGCCPMLVGGRCTIYADRPLACRTYDCRVYAATGVPTDRDAIAAQARRWKFGYPAADDRERQAAVLAAVRFMHEHPESLPGDAARCSRSAWPCWPSPCTSRSCSPRPAPRRAASRRMRSALARSWPPARSSSGTADSRAGGRAGRRAGRALLDWPPAGRGSGSRPAVEQTRL